MFKLEVEIKTDNAAFGDTPEDREHEVSSIMAGQVLPFIATGKDFGALRDSNGNTVGQWTLELGGGE